MSEPELFQQFDNFVNGKPLNDPQKYRNNTRIYNNSNNFQSLSSNLGNYNMANNNSNRLISYNNNYNMNNLKLNLNRAPSTNFSPLMNVLVANPSSLNYQTVKPSIQTFVQSPLAQPIVQPIIQPTKQPVVQSVFQPLVQSVVKPVLTSPTPIFHTAFSTASTGNFLNRILPFSNLNDFSNSLATSPRIVQVVSPSQPIVRTASITRPKIVIKNQDATQLIPIKLNRNPKVTKLLSLREKSKPISIALSSKPNITTYSIKSSQPMRRDEILPLIKKIF
jgi:hypothetical protein